MASAPKNILELDAKLEEMRLGSTNWNTEREALKCIRLFKIRRSEAVVRHGVSVLKSPSALGDEVWTVYEQVFLAAMDCHDRETGKMCYSKLNTQFPESNRVMRLKGISLEEQCQWAKAELVYKNMLEKDPTNMVARKRMVCIHKAQGNTAKAIDELNTYLEDYGADSTAWSELADLYVKALKFNNAKFCLEELLVMAPNSFQNHARYAELVYTQALANRDTDALIRARKYFAQSLELRIKNNLRAIYGMLGAALAISSAKGVRVEDQERNNEVYSWGVTALYAHYEAHTPEKLALIKKCYAPTLAA